MLPKNSVNKARLRDRIEELDDRIRLYRQAIPIQNVCYVGLTRIVPLFNASLPNKYTGEE